MRSGKRLVRVGLLAAVILLPTAALAVRGYRTLDGERAGLVAARDARLEGIARRAADGIRALLDERAGEETERPYVHYYPWYQPTDAVNYESIPLVRSPLAALADDPLVRGHFRIPASGEAETPLLSPAEREGTQPDPDRPTKEAFLASVREVTAFLRASGSESPESDPVVQEVAWQSLSNSVDWSNVYEEIAEANRGNPSSYNSRLASQQRLAPRAKPLDIRIDPVRYVPVRESGGSRLFGLRTARLVFDDREIVELQGYEIDLEMLRARIAPALLTSLDAEARLSLVASDDAPSPIRAPVAPYLPDWSVAAVPSDPGAIDQAMTARRREYLWTAGGLVAVSLVGLGLLLGITRSEVALARKRNDFVSAVTHELKTPLTAIRMHAEMLQDGPALPDDRKQGYYRTIGTESERLGRLIRNVLDYARIEEGTVAIAPQVGDLAAAVRDALAALEPFAASRGFAIEVDAEPDLPPVRFDRDAIAQVVVNLVDNAIKYTPEDVSDRRVSVAIRRAGDGVALEVTDRGIGIPAKERRRIFEPFHRVDDEAVRARGGAGIGLALVHRLAALHGGRTEVESPPAGGSRFRVWLPTGA